MLRSKFGKVHVNLGRPIALDALLPKHNPDWRGRGVPSATRRPAGSATRSGSWPARINTEINAAAAVTPINLVAMADLATPRQALPELDLGQLELYQRLLRERRTRAWCTVTPDSGEQMIGYAEAWRILERQKHPLGDIMRMNAENAVLATYYRNNILHLFAMPSLLGLCAS